MGSRLSWGAIGVATLADVSDSSLFHLKTTGHFTLVGMELKFYRTKVRENKVEYTRKRAYM